MSQARRQITIYARKNGAGILCAAAVTLLGGLAGCAHTPEPHFYTLDTTPSGDAKPVYNLQVERLRPHEALTRTDIMVMTSPTQVEYYALDRWVASLGELVPAKLGAEFGPPQNGRRTILVSGTILAFEAVDTPAGADAHIKLDLAFRDEGASRYEEPLLRKQYEGTFPAVSRAPAAVVDALSTGLARLAVSIAQDANRL